MSTADFIGVTRPSNGDPMRLPVTPRILQADSSSLFGGAGLAAGIIALEHKSERPVVWATGQYVSTTAPPAEVELMVELPTVGRSVTQGRVIGLDEGREIIAVLGASGTRREEHRGVWRVMPEVPPPDDCDGVERDPGGESMHRHVELRMAQGMFGFLGTGTPSQDGRSLIWARMPEVHHDSAALAIIADYLPSAVGNAVGEVVFATSLDNTIRFAGPVGERGDGWILCENTIEFVGAGFANGTCLLWSSSGELLATASQTMTVAILRA